MYETSEQDYPDVFKTCPHTDIVSKSRLLSLLIFSTMSILNNSGWARWQVAENTVSNWQADSIKALNIANIGSTGLKNASPAKSNSAWIAHRAHRFQSMQAQGLSAPLTIGHFAFRVQTKIILQTEKWLELQRISFWPLVKNLLKFIQNTRSFTHQLCNDIHSKAVGGEGGKRVPSFKARSLLSYGNVRLS